MISAREVTVSASLTVAAAGAGPAGPVTGHMLQRAVISFVLLERPP
jgi:2-polyprenyl-6-methoxyphenol hydroxylase-like FAD-dependent oxidoreductase